MFNGLDLIRVYAHELRVKVEVHELEMTNFSVELEGWCQDEKRKSARAREGARARGRQSERARERARVEVRGGG